MKHAIEHPVLGHMERDRTFGGYVSEEKVVGALGGRRFRLLLLDYTEDPNPTEFDAAIQAALSGTDAVLEEALPHVLQYFEDMQRLWAEHDEPLIELKSKSDIWSLVQFGKDLHVSRRNDGDSEDGIYFSLECNCDWEPEHGLEIVLRDGIRITKVGAYDGHLTNADAFGDPAKVGVVYVPMED